MQRVPRYHSALARDCEKECRALRLRLLKLQDCKREDRPERAEARRELRRLGKEEKGRQRKAVDEVIQGSNVVCSTLAVGAYTPPHLTSQLSCFISCYQ
jgi:ATP-dependent RNA/DNA helicase IGHMBP2